MKHSGSIQNYTNKSKPRNITTLVVLVNANLTSTYINNVTTKSVPGSRISVIPHFLRVVNAICLFLVSFIVLKQKAPRLVGAFLYFTGSRIEVRDDRRSVTSFRPYRPYQELQMQQLVQGSRLRVRP